MKHGGSRHEADQLRTGTPETGFATPAPAAGVPERTITAQTRHKSVTIVRRYSALEAYGRRTQRRVSGCKATGNA